MTKDFPSIQKIYRYPVKGLSGEELSNITLLTEFGMPLDRRFAVARRSDVFDPENPVAKPKGQFLMLMQDEALALLETRFEDERGRFSVAKDGMEILNISLDLRYLFFLVV